MKNQYAIPFIELMIGVLVLVFGLILGQTVTSTAAAPGVSIGSFTGASSLNNLVPFVYYAAILVVGVGLIGLGAWTFHKAGRA